MKQLPLIQPIAYWPFTTAVYGRIVADYIRRASYATVVEAMAEADMYTDYGADMSVGIGKSFQTWLETNA